MTNTIKTILKTSLLTTLTLLNIAYAKDIKLSNDAYRGPIFDAMAQVDEKNLKKALKEIKKSKVDKVALFARSKEPGDKNEKKIEKTYEKYPDTIVLGAPKLFFKDGDYLYDDYIKNNAELLSRSKYRFNGEILFVHVDKTHGFISKKGESYINPTHPSVFHFVEKVQKYNKPIMVHWELYNLDRDQKDFFKLFRKFPEVKFIMPHMGFGKLDRIERILKEHPNVYMTISKKTLPKSKAPISDPKVIAELGDSYLDKKTGLIKEDWRELLIKYQDRLLFATDAHKKFRWKKYTKVIKEYRNHISQLPKEVVDKISFQNAEKLYKISVDD